MKKLMLVAAALVALALPAAADDQQQIKVSTAFDLLNALNIVTGNHDKVVGQGTGQRVAAVPYDLSADALWAMTQDIGILRKFVEDVQVVQKNINAQAEAKNGGPVGDAGRDAAGNALPPTPAQAALAKRLQELYDSERPIPKLVRIRRQDLQGALSGPEHLPGQVLASIMTIVDP